MPPFSLDQLSVRLTGARQLVLRVLANSDDHPDAETIHRRAAQHDSRLSMATVYRALRVLESAHLVSRREFGDGRARYELTQRKPHDHLIDLSSGAVIEFEDDRLNALANTIATRLGFKMRGYRFEIFGIQESPRGEGSSHQRNKKT